MLMGERMALCAGLLLLMACDSSSRERTEAQRFLTFYGALDHRDPLVEREREVGELAALPLHIPSVIKARDACVVAHRTLIGAERAQENAARALDQALAEKIDGEALAKPQADKVQESITQAELALSNARTRFAPCEAEARALALRYARR